MREAKETTLTVQTALLNQEFERIFDGIAERYNEGSRYGSCGIRRLR